MTEKENPPIKPRKLKKIDEYREKIPIAWKIYQQELAKKVHPKGAERRAMKSLYPEDNNRYSTLETWKKHGLWPPVKEDLSDKRLRIFRQEESKKQQRNGLTVISGGRKKKIRSLPKPPENSEQRPELSEREILQKVRKMLDKIEITERQWTGGRQKKFSTIKKRIFAGRIPVALINEIHRFKGSNTYHLERALILYVKIMDA